MKKARQQDPGKFSERKKTPAARKARRNARLVASYGITAAELDRMLEARNWICDLCQKPIPRVSGVRGPHVDHKHGTRIVRGILHGSCSSALGLLQDSPELMTRAAQYVRTEGRFDD